MDLKVLMVEDSDPAARLVQEILREVEGTRFEIVRATRLCDALVRLSEIRYDAILLDLALPDAVGLEALTTVNEAAPEVPVVVLTGLENEAIACQALKNGAQDYLVKGQGDGRLLARSIRYAVERMHSQRQINFLAHHDGLTGLPNRTLFLDRLDHALALARRDQSRVAVLFLDVDRFKLVNDTYGHAAGDGLLIAVAERLRTSTRESDTVGRLGGDEFAVILTEIKRLEDVSAFAEKLLKTLSSSVLIGDREVFFSVSIGVSTCPDDATDAGTLLRTADLAMYRSRRDRRGSFRFYGSPPEGVAAAGTQLAADLRLALVREELCLHYQPLISLESGRIVGCEALVRWQHPRLGMLSPSWFIPIAEENGLIGALGDWVLRAACASAKKWNSGGKRAVRVAVNLSTGQIGRPDLARSVAAALKRSGLAPEFLELELNEQSVLDDPEAIVENLREVRSLGVRLVVDDFGTGHFSLSHLRLFPIDGLKIDGSFVRGVVSDPADSSIVQAILAIARTLGLDTTAEGVETEDQLNFLTTHGCTRAQGYLFSRPLPPASMGRLLLERSQ